LVKHVPKQLSQWLLQILPTVWNTLTHSAHVYVATVVNETEEIEHQVDLDGNALIEGGHLGIVILSSHVLMTQAKSSVLRIWFQASSNLSTLW
jgi:hypothetical protein